jgi:hypothetical protein
MLIIKTKDRFSLYKYLITLLLVLLISGCGGSKVRKQLAMPIMPAEPVEVYWAGFAFLGDWNQRETRYPYTAAIATETAKKGVSVIDDTLRDKIKDFTAPGFILKHDLGDLRTGKALSVAIALSYEDIYVLPFDGDFKASYDIAMNVVVFDFEEKKVIAVYPLRFLRNEMYKSRPTKKQHKEVIKALLTSNNRGFNLFDETIKRMQGMVIKSSYGNYLGVNSVELAPKAIDKIPNKLLQNKIIETQIAQQFEGALSKSAYVPMVPFTKGEAVGGTMAARFSNGDSFELQLPEKDYLINLKLRGFKRKTSSEHDGFTSLITLTVEKPSGKKTVNAKFSNNIWVLKEMTGENSKGGRWTIYEESLGKLINDLAKQIVSTDSDWLKKHSATKDVDDQFENFRTLLIKSQ